MKQYIVKVYEDRTEWYNEQNQLDREDGPAIEYANGSKYWYRNDQCHREGGHAIEFADGTKYWYLNGQNLSKEEFNQRTSKPVSDCSGKVVEIDGKRYELKPLST